MRSLNQHTANPIAMNCYVPTPTKTIKYFLLLLAFSLFSLASLAINVTGCTNTVDDPAVGQSESAAIVDGLIVAEAEPKRWKG